MNQKKMLPWGPTVGDEPDCCLKELGPKYIQEIVLEQEKQIQDKINSGVEQFAIYIIFNYYCPIHIGQWTKQHVYGLYSFLEEVSQFP